MLEMLVVLAIAGILAGAAGDLLVEGNRVIVKMGAELKTPLIQPATAAIRADLESAASPPESFEEWITGPLEIRTLDGNLVRYEMSNGALVREERDSAGRRIRTRTVARGLTGWKWILMSPRLVGVHLVCPGVTGLWDQPTRGGRLRPAGWQSETMWVALRVGGGGIR